MGEQTKNMQSKRHFLSKDTDAFDSLIKLALNMRSTWNHSTDQIWQQLNPTLWDLTQNPWVVLQTVSQEKLYQILADPTFRKIIDDLLQDKRDEEEAPAWFQQTYPKSHLTCVAYFCMEYMLSEALPIYSGGLGNVAGDQLKAASDLGIPVVGIGLLYQQGYFRQDIDKEGKQHALYPYSDPGQLPITPLRMENGEWLRLEIALSGYSIWLRTWQVQVGRVKLYLLDSNDAANYPVHRGITSELYGGGSELRLKQELVLGIGGWRLLSALGIKPEVCHLNEGHAAFAVLERARSLMKETGQQFSSALAVTKAGNIFTTHTAVAAGFDHFEPALIEQYLAGYAESELGITLQQLLALGRKNPDDVTESFNMAYLALRGSGAVNAVSSLHGRVSRHLFAPLFSRWPVDEVPVGHVTNGVHMPTWDSAAADAFWTKLCGKSRWMGEAKGMRSDVCCASNTELWQLRGDSRIALVDYARKRLSQQLAIRGVSSGEVEAAKHLFDSNTLTLGFARRFASYKRPDLLLHDPERLLRLLTNPQRPVQLIIAGKAHPADKDGQALILKWMQFIEQTEARAHVIFLSDYDMHLTQHMVQGVDVWVNTPRRPWEACGTSGMKVLVNGGINLSELDGWWAEAYTPEVGWAFGDGLEHDNDPDWDAKEAEALYDILENEVVPEFYSRDKQGIPVKWVSKMRESMSRLTPKFSTNRAVCEYTEKHYLTAAASYLERVANNGKRGDEIANWLDSLDQKWASLRFGEMKIESNNGTYLFEIQVYLDGLKADAVKVELYANGMGDDLFECIEMNRLRQLVGAENGYTYYAKVTSLRPAHDFTARIVPFYPGVVVPLEASHILWSH